MKYFLHRCISLCTKSRDVCVICQEEMSHASTVAYGCGHEFHGACLVQNLVHGNFACPICRFDPNYDPNDANYDPPGVESDDALRPRPTIEEALRVAERSADSSVRRSLGTIAKWRQKMRNADAEYRRLNHNLIMREKEEVFDVVESYEDRIMSRFERKNKKELQRRKGANKRLRNATRLYQRYRARLAAKFGWSPEDD